VKTVTLTISERDFFALHEILRELYRTEMNKDSENLDSECFTRLLRIHGLITYHHDKHVLGI
jgi:hypothetical protein